MTVTNDIKETVAELERRHAEYEKSCDRDQREIAQGQAMDTYWKVGPSLLPAIRRWMAIEEAAVRYREASEADQNLRMSADMAAVNYARRRNADAREDLFALLPVRKEDT